MISNSQNDGYLTGYILYLTYSTFWTPPANLGWIWLATNVVILMNHVANLIKLKSLLYNTH